jgi:POT family proton-dependent oligopeptide transporter
MPPGIPFIVGNEAAERFCYYGLQGILVIYMTQYLRARSGGLATMTGNDATQWFHWFVATNYFFPILGAIVADAFLGKYLTIIPLSLVYCVGSITLASDPTRLGLFLGLGLIAVGAGGIKPCVSSHVGDQFGPDNQNLISRAFGWFYLSVNIGSTVSTFATPWLLKHYGPRVAFGIPAALMLIATIVFWSGRYRFAHIPPAGKRFLSETFSREGLAVLGRLALVYLFVAIAFWSLWYQNFGEWVLQAQRMDLHFLGVTWLAAQIQTVNPIFIVTFIPLFQFVVYPAIDRVFPLTPLRKIGIGFVFTAASFLISAWIEARLAAGARPSVGWQVPAYALLSAGEVMVSITSLEFAYTQAPKPMKSIVMSLYLLSISVGNAFTALVHRFIANPDGSIKLSGPAYYEMFAAVSVGCTAIFVFVARRYRGKTYVQGEAEALAETAPP